MDEFPNEILSNIASYLLQPSLCAVVQTSQQWKAVALPLLYRYPHLSGDIACVDLTTTLEARQKYRSYVQSLTIEDPEPSERSHLGVHLSKLLPMLATISRLEVNGPDTEGPCDNTDCRIDRLAGGRTAMDYRFLIRSASISLPNLTSCECSDDQRTLSIRGITNW